MVKRWIIRSFCMLSVLLGVGWANISMHGPCVQQPADNYWATYHYCTEQHRGWPFAVYSVYPQGYVNPEEPLAWDIDPRYDAWHLLGLILDIGVAELLVAAPAIPWILAWYKTRKQKTGRAFPVVVEEKKA